MQSIRQYRIVRQLGAGGMGVVHLAEDDRLKRKVALKVVSPAFHDDPVARERLFREAQAAAAIDHANVAAIYEIGEQDGVAFIAMQYIDGETLHDRLSRGTLPAGEAVDVALSVAEALHEAHRLSIVHRDLKPQNVMLTVRGQVKVLDFGLAKTLGPVVGGEDDATRREITRRGELVGTLVYMSPEQLRGEALDPRSDIFAFGMLLYEVLSGRRPFEAPTTVEVIANILTRQPPALPRAIPKALAKLVSRCLEKEADQRYRDMSEVITELKAVRGALADPDARTAAVKPRAKRKSRTIDSIAVLPFENAGADEYLAEGITDLITMQLARLPRLRVMARSTAYSYKGRVVDARQVGSDLNIRAVMTGRVRAQGDSLSVAVELVDATDGALIWCEQYDRPAGDVHAVENEIATTVAERFRVPLSGSARRRVAAPYQPSPEAYRLYLQGRFWWGKRPGEGYLKAIDFFQQAIDCDPLYPLAYSGLADALAVLGSWESGERRPHEVMPAARAAAKRALDLDDHIAEAHASLGYVALHYDRDWREARNAFAKAVELNPNCVNGLHWASHFFITAGDVEQSTKMSRDVLAVDPLDLICNIHMAWHHWMSRNAAAGLDVCRAYAQIDSRSMWVPFFAGVLHELEGRWDEAIAQLETARRIAPAISFTLAGLAHAHGMAGNRDAAESLLGELKSLSVTRYVTAYDFAIIHLGLGNIDEALTSLEAAVDERSSWTVYFDAEPRLDPLRDHPRFQAVRGKVGLPVRS